MSDLETKEGVYSLSFLRDTDNGKSPSHDRQLIADNRGMGDGGKWWDDSIERPQLDLSHMNLEWVNHTQDALFSVYSRDERYLLYLVFVRELSSGKFRPRESMMKPAAPPTA